MPQPPFDRTISEGSGDGAGLKVEGNTFSRPFGLDFLQDVISVQWSSALFVVSDDAFGVRNIGERFPQIFRSKGGKKWKGPAEVDNSSFIDPANPAIPEFSIGINAVVGGKIHDGEQGKVLLLGGTYEFSRTSFAHIDIFDHELLSYSYDGETWIPVILSYNYDEPTPFGGSPDIETIVLNLLFIPETKLFYADVEYLDSVWARDLWSSGDGVEWEKVSSDSVPEADVPDNPPFVCKFVKLAFETQNDNGLVGATNPQTGTILKFSNIRTEGNNLGGHILYDDPVLRNDAPIDIPGISTDGLCFAGGSFIVSGHVGSSGVVYRSGDDGKTWEKVKDVDLTNSEFLYCGGA